MGHRRPLGATAVGFDIWSAHHDLANFYVNTGRRNLIDVLIECARFSLEFKRDVDINSYRDSPAEVLLP
jgi:hypothetical protein